jgi:hypothetical protein
MQRSTIRWSVVRLVALIGAVFALPHIARGAATTTREPAFGLPHIFADTDLELARENGREIAKDRLGQLILLARVGRGNLYQAFGILDPSTLDDDIVTRQTQYTSSELNNMWLKFPQRERDIVMEYCKGVNDTIDAIYAGSLPEPIEVNLLRNLLLLGDDLFGNKNNISDQVDPNYAPAGGAWPNAGFQFTPEMAVSIAVLEVRNFGFESLEEDARFAELQALIAKHGNTSGAQIWDDLNFLNDPLAPVSVPDPTTPGFGGPLAGLAQPQWLATAERFPRYDYLAQAEKRRAAAEQRKEMAMKLGAWPALGSYAWIIAGGKSATNYPWLGGFPQTGIQTPSIMHFVENRSAEGTSNRIHGIGMEFAGAPLVLIGQTDNVAYTTTTALLRLVDTFFEQLVGEDSDALHYNDEGTPAPVNQRTETFLGGLAPSATRVFFRTHERNGNGGSRPVIDFTGDSEGTVDSATSNTIVDAGAFDASFVGGHVAITQGLGAGQIRSIGAVPDANTLQTGSAWTTTPDPTSTYVAVKAGHNLIAVAVDSLLWQEESTTVLGFSQFQRAENVLDMRKAVRIIPSTHNFFAADNQLLNGVGTASGYGNIGYWSSGFSRYRLGGQDSRLPLDGTLANPLLVASGSVMSATPTTVTVSGGSLGDLSALPMNYRYDNPTQVGAEYVVSIVGGSGGKQSRRIASNAGNALTLEAAWGVTPAPGDRFEIAKIVGMPEAINPAEGYTANWNNKAATKDEGNNFGRQFRHIFILERLAAENAWDRAKQRQLNKDVAGLDGKGDIGRYLLPRIREAVDKEGNGGNPAVDTVLAALEANQAAPEFGRNFIDPVSATTNNGEVAFMNNLVNKLATDIYGDEYSGAVSTPTGGRALNIVQHAIDSKAGDLTGDYPQVYAGDYFAIALSDHFMCYKTKTTPDTQKFAKQENLAISDAFESGNFDAKKPAALCAPASKDGSTVADNTTHLEAYKLKASSGEPKHVPEIGITVEDVFGTLKLDTVKPNRLLVPSGKALGGPASLPTGTVDHFKCYKVKISDGAPKFPKHVQATVTDQFQTNRVYDIKKPVRLCVPANTGGGILHAVNHLMCYKAKLADAPKHVPVEGQIHTANDFGSEQLDTIKEQELCVSATRNWEVIVRDSFSALASGGIPADSTRGVSHYRHPLQALFSELDFEPTPFGNRGTYEQIVDVQPTVNGEFMFPLGQSGLIEGSFLGVTSIDPNFTSLQPIWRDWRFVPILHVSADLGGAGADSDGDGVLDGYERWYYGDLSQGAASDTDADGSTLLQEFTAGSDPTDSDTDDDGILDGADSKPQDRLMP